MDSFLASLLSFLLLYRYVAIFLLAYIGAVGLPFPVNVLLLAVGAFSSQGYFNVWIALAAASVGNTLGDLTDYGITRKFGNAILRALRVRSSPFFSQLEEELRTDSAVTVFVTRFAGSLSSIANFVAGTVGVPFWTFFTYDLIGNIIEPGGALLLGYLVGNYWDNFSNLLSLIAVTVAVAVILFVIARMYKRMMRKYEERERRLNNRTPEA